MVTSCIAANSEPTDKLREYIGVLEAALDKGNIVAAFHLGNMYMEGFEGVEKDLKKGFYYLQISANAGHIQSQYNLAASYKLGDGTTQNRKDALYWYMKAAEQGHSNAQLQAALIHRTNGDHAKTIELLDIAARHGLVDAQFLLAGFYQIGEGIPQNYRKAYIWYSIASANGDKEAIKLRDKVSKKIDSDTLSKAQDEASQLFGSISNNE